MARLVDVLGGGKKPKKRTKRGKKQQSSHALKMVQRVYPEVEVVVDGEVDIMVDVTARDASSKAVKNHSACALAVACRRALDLDGALIARSVAYLIKGTEAARYMMPPSATREVVVFDRGGGFDIGQYKLTAPKKTSLLGSRADRPQDSSRTRNGKDLMIKRFRHVTQGIRANLGSRDVV